jgi:hypothetical protein
MKHNGETSLSEMGKGTIRPRTLRPCMFRPVCNFPEVFTSPPVITNRTPPTHGLVGHLALHNLTLYMVPALQG